jgi:hypothetical protein
VTDLQTRLERFALGRDVEGIGFEPEKDVRRKKSRGEQALIEAGQREFASEHFPVDQRRDQVAGDDEEHVDADESALRKPKPA